MTYVCIALIAYIALRELLAARERRELLLRIQDPQQAIARQVAPRKPQRSPAPISADDDKRWKELREERDGSN